MLMHFISADRCLLHAPAGGHVGPGSLVAKGFNHWIKFPFYIIKTKTNVL